MRKSSSYEARCGRSTNTKLGIKCHLFVAFFMTSLLLTSCYDGSQEKISIFINDPNLSIRDSVYVYGGEMFNGLIWTATDPSLNELLVEVTDGKLHGQYKKWFPGGSKPQMHKVYFQGEEHGPQKGWHTSGHLSYEYTTNHGHRTGLYREYYPSGKLQIERQYLDGQEMSQKILDPNGEILVNYVLKDGRYYGLMGSSECFTVDADVLR